MHFAGAPCTLLIKTLCIVKMKENPILKLGIENDPAVLLLRFYDAPRIFNEKLKVIGTDEGNLLAINKKLEILSIDKESSEIIRFMNSSPQALVNCITAYKEYGKEVTHASSEELEIECVKRLENSIREIDFAALENINNWWSCIVAQAYEGNL